MGNSGSIHHIASGLDELNSYYRHQNGPDIPIPSEFGHPQSRLPSQASSQLSGPSQPHVRVLPVLNDGPKLRCTMNGAILHSGGTISGRNLPGPPAVLQRSKTSINYDLSNRNSAPAFQRSKTQLSILPHKSREDEDHRYEVTTHHKRFVSEPDLRMTDDEEQYSSSAQQKYNPAKMGKAKMKNKKRKAPPAPVECKLPPHRHEVKSKPVELPTSGSRHPQIQDSQRKLRLFKTRVESKPQTKPDAPEMARHAKAKPLPPPPSFRREKTFDSSQLPQRRTAAPKQSHSPVVMRRPQGPQMDKILRSRKVSTPPMTSSTADGPEFKLELEAATKRRSLAVEHLKRLVGHRASMPRQRQPDVKLPAPKDPAADASNRGQSRIPQLTKTFYFGMEKESEMAKPDIVARKKPMASSAVMTKPTTLPRLTTESSESALSSDDADGYYPMTNRTECDESKDGSDINVLVRPTLPRRQLEIPRFSPATAWRMLSEEHKQLLLQLGENRLRMTEDEPVQRSQPQPIEDRIQRNYREPHPLYPDNKSGDSGISGDAGLPERPESPLRTNYIHIDGLDDDGADDMVVGKLDPILAPWTPQQDLEEESSSDGELVKPDELTNPSRGHVFSLSLPRENHLSIYGDKDKPCFSSLQKIKRTVSGAFSAGSSGGRSGSGGHSNSSQVESPSSPTNTNLNFSNHLHPLAPLNYRNDNWLLSKSAPNSIESQQMSASGTNLDRDNNNYIVDRQISIQPLSLSYLTAGKHVIYLPNQPIGESSDYGHDVATATPTVRAEEKPSKTPRTKELENLQDTSPLVPNTYSSLGKPANLDEVGTNCKNNNRNHRFTFQSTVRQIERRRLADKLSKEAEQREAQRKSELEAMRRVEEEFQRKRAREKASIRQQLRLYSMEESQPFTSLPSDWHQEHENAAPTHHRADPDGAVSSSSPSPVAQELLKVKAVPYFNKDDSDTPLDTKLPHPTSTTSAKRSSASVQKSSRIPVSNDVIFPNYQTTMSRPTANLSDKKKVQSIGQEWNSANPFYSTARSLCSSDSEFSMHFGEAAMNSRGRSQYHQSKCAELY